MRASISREFWFSAAHRIEGHVKCGRLHGHNYKVVVHLSGKINKEGMVEDFGVVDKQIKPLIDDFDHSYLVSISNLNAGDKYAEIALDNGDGVLLGVMNSTAEEMAILIHLRVCEALSYASSDVRVTVQETPKNEASYP